MSRIVSARRHDLLRGAKVTNPSSWTQVPGGVSRSTYTQSMPHLLRHRGAARASRLLPAVWLTLAALVPGAYGQSSPSADERAFLGSLAADEGKPVDTRRLAKLLFGIGATLEGDLSAVRLLQAAVAPREATPQPIEELTAERFEAYAAALAALGEDVSAHLDHPASARHLFRVLSSGHLTCWRLDAYVRLVDIYGARSSDLVTILSTTEACNRFRWIASRARVLVLVEDALGAADAQRRENAMLREEMAELERLLEDLRRIEAQP
jgi:hypothetical protein